VVSEDGESVVQVRWAEVFGIEGEPSLEEIRSRGMVSEDGESVVQVRWAEVFGIEGEPSLEEIRSSRGVWY